MQSLGSRAVARRHPRQHFIPQEGKHGFGIELSAIRTPQDFPPGVFERDIRFKMCTFGTLFFCVVGKKSLTVANSNLIAQEECMD